LIHGGLSQAYGLGGENGNGTEEGVGEGAGGRGGGGSRVNQEGGGEEGEVKGAKCCGYVMLQTERGDRSVVNFVLFTPEAPIYIYIILYFIYYLYPVLLKTERGDGSVVSKQAHIATFSKRTRDRDLYSKFIQ
jgi:hypothetical protein